MMRCHQRPGVRECGVHPCKAGIARKCSLVMFDRPPEPVIRALVPVETAFQVQVMSFAVVSGGAATHRCGHLRPKRSGNRGRNFIVEREHVAFGRSQRSAQTRNPSSAAISSAVMRIAAPDDLTVPLTTRSAFSSVPIA